MASRFGRGGGGVSLLGFVLQMTSRKMTVNKFRDGHEGTITSEHTLSDRSYPWPSSNHQTPSWCLGCISSGFLSIQTMVPVVNKRGRVGANAFLPASLHSIQSPLLCSHRYMNIPRLAQSFDQTDHGDWARSYCPRLSLEYGTARIESILKIKLGSS